ncbi:hypothetical protein BH10ACI3_BH10ACI3_03640 [soil metagenome]
MPLSRDEPAIKRNKTATHRNDPILFQNDFQIVTDVTDIDGGPEYGLGIETKVDPPERNVLRGPNHEY